MWNELSIKRRRKSRTYQEDTNPTHHVLECRLSTLHYESEIDSGVYDTEVNFIPARVNNAQFDGWRVTKGNWHYALGKDLANHGDTDGWVGFGGRQGQHWFKFRLARVGYLHWLTRTWDDIGGTPTYNRANLSRTPEIITIGPNNDEITVSHSTEWSDIWTTPGGGSLSVKWRVDGNRLKEDIVISQAGREWITANRPPTTPANETFFGFVFQLDWSDIPRRIRQGIELGPDDDFADDGEGIELKDALDRLLAFMPLSYVYAGQMTKATMPSEHRAELRKRFWRDGDGNHYLLVGCRVDALANLQSGDLIFDPTIDEEVGASADDSYQDFYDPSGNFPSGTSYDMFVNNKEWFAARFQTIALDGSETINSDTYISWYCINWNTMENQIYGEDVDDAGAFTADDGHLTSRATNLTTANVEWSATLSTSAYNNSPDISAIITEIIQRGGWSENNDLAILQNFNTGCDVELRMIDAGASYEPQLHIDYTAAAGVGYMTTNKGFWGAS